MRLMNGSMYGVMCGSLDTFAFLFHVSYQNFDVLGEGELTQWNVLEAECIGGSLFVSLRKQYISPAELLLGSNGAWRDSRVLQSL
jgi:hypothetical protein